MTIGVSFKRALDPDTVVARYTQPDAMSGIWFDGRSYWISGENDVFLFAADNATQTMVKIKTFNISSSISSFIILGGIVGDGRHLYVGYLHTTDQLNVLKMDMQGNILEILGGSFALTTIITTEAYNDLVWDGRQLITVRKFDTVNPDFRHVHHDVRNKVAVRTYDKNRTTQAQCWNSFRHAQANPGGALGFQDRDYVQQGPNSSAGLSRTTGICYANEGKGSIDGGLSDFSSNMIAMAHNL